MNFYYNRWFKLISADMTKVLVCIMNSRESQSSYIRTLYGDPDQYVHKLGNDSFADQLPIQQKFLVFREGYKFLHYVSIHYESQRIFCSNNYHGRLEYGFFIYMNSTYTQFLDFVPDSKQVITIRIHFRRNQ